MCISIKLSLLQTASLQAHLARWFDNQTFYIVFVLPWDCLSKTLQEELGAIFGIFAREREQ